MNKIVIATLVCLVIGAVLAVAIRGADALLGGAVVGAIAGFLIGWFWKARTEAGSVDG